MLNMLTVNVSLVNSFFDDFLNVRVYLMIISCIRGNELVSLHNGFLDIANANLHEAVMM